MKFQKLKIDNFVLIKFLSILSGFYPYKIELNFSNKIYIRKISYPGIIIYILHMIFYISCFFIHLLKKDTNVGGSIKNNLTGISFSVRHFIENILVFIVFLSIGFSFKFYKIVFKNLKKVMELFGKLKNNYKEIFKLSQNYLILIIFYGILISCGLIYCFDGSTIDEREVLYLWIIPNFYIVILISNFVYWLSMCCNIINILNKLLIKIC